MPINFSAHSTQSGADNWYDISAWGWFKKKDQHEGRKKVIVFHEDKTSNDYLNIFLTDIPNHQAQSGSGFNFITFRRNVSFQFTELPYIIFIHILFHVFRPVSVQTTNGASYTAERVIVTLPIGALKKKMIEGNFFTSPLSARKSTALQNWGVGRSGWIFVAFPFPFWTLSGAGFKFLQWEQFNNTEFDLEEGEEWTRAIFSATRVVHRYIQYFLYSIHLFRL